MDLIPLSEGTTCSYAACDNPATHRLDGEGFVEVFGFYIYNIGFACETHADYDLLQD